MLLDLNIDGIIMIMPQLSATQEVHSLRHVRDGRFGPKWVRSDWPQLGQIRDFFRSDFSTFWRCSAKMY